MKINPDQAHKPYYILQAIDANSIWDRKKNWLLIPTLTFGYCDDERGCEIITGNLFDILKYKDISMVLLDYDIGFRKDAVED